MDHSESIQELLLSQSVERKPSIPAAGKPPALRPLRQQHGHACLPGQFGLGTDPALLVLKLEADVWQRASWSMQVRTRRRHRSSQ